MGKKIDNPITKENRDKDLMIADQQIKIMELKQELDNVGLMIADIIMNGGTA